ncbi:MAG: SAM-dependent methyltransferase [Gammaproteobacteria bacterium]|nr:SAM-dependent methyltransferase [Gammaproteobacteria bacterium]NNJ85054.1 SAM-dependent methyltransferase [Gammaproteobacteria bacterium]
MKLEKIAPFGRSLEEYRKIFSLSGDDLEKNIVGVGDGPASFNAEMSALGKTVISIDPLYSLQPHEIEERFYSVVDDIIAQVEATPHDWVWSYHKSPEHLKDNRTAALRCFIADYEAGKAEGRYILGELPSLDFAHGKFQLAVCSHFLFLYSEHLTYGFHLSSVLEMLRIAHEVRIFPLLTLMLEVSPYVQPLILELESRGVIVSVESVEYELQRGGNKMLRIQHFS